MPNLIPVAFQGDTIDTIREDGRVWIVVRRVSDSLGIDADSQRSKLAEKEWATTALITVVAADSKNREVFCLDLRSLPMWLATIEPSRVAEHVRPKLVAYQREAADTLADHFLGKRGQAAPEYASARAMLPDLCQRALVEGDFALAHHLTGYLAGCRRSKPGQLDLFDADPATVPRPARQRVTEEDRRRRILTALVGQPGARTRRAIVVRSGVRRSTAYRVLAEMIRSGQVIESPAGLSVPVPTVAATGEVH